MNVEDHGWYSQRLGRDMGIRVYGHYGLPLLAFPTSGGDEREYEGQGMVAALAHHIDSGRVKLFCVDSVNQESWYNRQAHPAHKCWLQAQYDAYIAHEVAPFISGHCFSAGIPITTTGCSFGAYHAVNTLLKHPDLFPRCVALSGIYDLRRLLDGYGDANCHLNNPVEYAADLIDEYDLHYLDQSDIHLATGSGPYEDSSFTFQLSAVLSAREIPHTLDDWGAEGGHDWPYWKRQMDLYVGRLF